MNNLINAIELQQEKLEVIKYLLSRIDVEDSNQSTSAMLKDLKATVKNILITDF